MHRPILMSTIIKCPRNTNGTNGIQSIGILDYVEFAEWNSCSWWPPLKEICLIIFSTWAITEVSTSSDARNATALRGPIDSSLSWNLASAISCNNAPNSTIKASTCSCWAICRADCPTRQICHQLWPHSALVNSCFTNVMVLWMMFYLFISCTN